MITEKLTLPDLLNRSCALYPNNLSLNFVTQGDRTYRQLHREVNALARHLAGLGVTKGDKVAILSASMPNWAIAQFAIATIGAIAVPVLPGFSPAEVKNILEHAEVKVLFVSRLLVKTLEGLDLPLLKHKILANTLATIPDGKYSPEEMDALAPDVDMTNDAPMPPAPVNEKDVASIIYTSGTTGFSKGVVLTHENLTWNARQSHTIQPVGPRDRFLSILPMAHAFENTLGLILPLMYGSSVYYLDRVPTPRLLVPAMQKVRPTVMLSVPLVIEKIYKTQIAPALRASALTRLLCRTRAGRKLLHRAAGRKLARTFGGQLEFFGIGGAKLDATVERFLREARFPYSIGYGLTETSPLIAGANPSHTFFQGVGPAMEGVSMKIDQPDERGEGEILVKGRGVMQGYYRQPKLNAETFTPDGWFRTGDLGSIDERGRLTIRGRIKTMILGSSGENIYPEEIESIINHFRFVDESLVVEKSGRLVAMVHLNMEELEKHYRHFKNQAENYKSLAGDYLEELQQEIRDYVNARVSNFSRLQLVLVQHEPFEKTPSMKIKRFLYNK
ncbi:MAG: AMP-binding protein [Odoribacteraceae bacterium]|jgi:long-chain acyl-CoA synthetase|nr:AMP-binding protein [Odoribacteraceae bacterium]